MTVKTQIALTINSTPYTVDADLNQTLLGLLRDDLGLTGTKEGCGTGDCGACTVLLDGKPVNACLVLAAEVSGAEVLTVEGLAVGGELDPIQSAFIAEGAVQCGFCTAGMLMVSKALLTENPNPTEPEVRQAIAGDLCRCTGYVRIVRAILRASEAGAAGRGNER